MPGKAIQKAVQTRRRPAEVRELLISGAARVFKSKGYTQATIEDIVTEADVSPSVFWRHFRTKSELYREAMIEPFRQFLNDFRAIWERRYDQHWGNTSSLDPGELGIEIMTTYLTELHKHLHAHRDTLLGLVSTDGRLDPAAAAELHSLFQDVFAELRVWGETEAENVTWLPSTDMELTHRLIVSMIAGMVAFEPWFLPTGRSRKKRAHIFDHMAKLLLYGMRLEPQSKRNSADTAR